ncbi:hypothetical protein WA158_003574 [Blastocystis sp. Blastoise]
MSSLQFLSVFKSFAGDLNNAFNEAVDGDIESNRPPSPLRAKDVLKEEPSKSNDELELCKAKLAAYKDELDRYKSRVINFQEELRENDNKLIDAQKAYQIQISDKDKQISELTTKLDDVTKKCEDQLNSVTINTSLVSQSEFDSLQKEFTIYKENSSMKEKEITAENDDLQNELSSYRQQLATSQSNLAEVLRQLNEFKSGTGNLYSWMEQVLSTLLTYLGKRPQPFPPPPSALGAKNKDWCQNHIEEAENVGAAMQSLRASLSEKLSQETSICETAAKLFGAIGILEQDETVNFEDIPSYLSRATTEILSYGDTYAAIIGGGKKKETEMDDMKNKVLILEEEKKALVNKYSSLAEQVEKEKDRNDIYIESLERKYETLKSDFNKQLKLVQEAENQQTELDTEKRQFQKEIQVLKNSIEKYEMEGKQKNNEIEGLKANILSSRQINESLKQHIASLVSNNHGDISKSERSASMVNLAETEKQEILAEAMNKYNTLLLEYQNLEIENKDVNDRLNMTQDDLDNSYNQIKNLQLLIQNSVVDCNTSKYEQQISTLKQQIAELEHTIEKSKYDREGEISNLKNQYQDMIRNGNEQQNIALRKLESEIFELRKILKSQQSISQSTNERTRCEMRMLRQLLITYMTATEGGPSLKILMEKLNLSTDEQRVCLQAQIQRSIPKKPKKRSFFSFLWGDLEDSFQDSVDIDENASLSDLWVQFLMKETE